MIVCNSIFYRLASLFSLLRISFVFLFIAVFLSACASSSFIKGVPIDNSQFEQIELGMTKKEVGDVLGKPYHQYHYETGETWVWTYVLNDYAESLALVFIKDKVSEISLYNEALSGKRIKKDTDQTNKQNIDIKEFF